jgi:hypothetical protein
MENNKKLHIICHDIPWPADYGGVVDLFYKLKYLYAEGIKIKLHCFLYGNRKEQDELNKYCETVYYYKRQTGWKGFSFAKPYIVLSRANTSLLKNLLLDNEPVLMEGIHCTAFLPELLKNNRKIYLRLHNVESLYYSQLFKHEKNLFKKIFFLKETISLLKYERRIPEDLPIFSVSQKDVLYYREVFKKKNIKYLPVFIQDTDIKCKEGLGDYCLYHGNLAVSENEKAVTWLLKNVFEKIKFPFIIAGKEPSTYLQRLAAKNINVKIVANPLAEQMNDLVANAHIHVLPSFNSTGIKLKLINALFNGRHCIVNEAAVDGSGLEAACHIGVNADAIASIIIQLYHHPFSEEEIMLRKKLLPSIFDNQKNARQLIQWIY